MTWYEPPHNSKKSEVADTDNSDGKSNCTRKSWLEALPSKSGLVLAAILADIMTEGLMPDQENILGNFVSAVGSLISYKAARDDSGDIQG